MADLKLDVDISAVLQADKALRDFESRFSQLEQAARRGVTSQDKLVAVFDRLDKAGLSLSQVYRSMDRDLDNSAKTAARLENEFRNLALSGKSARDSARAMEQAFRQQEQAAEEVARAARQQAQAIEQSANSYRQLRASIDPAYRAQQQLLQAKRTIRQQLQQNNITMEQAVALMRQYRQAQVASTVAVAGSTRGINGMGMVMQQTGYQVGDFLVQVQGGTNFMVAFGQQATQLVGILPMLGAGFMGLSMKALVGLSAGLGIAIPLMTAIGAAFMRTRQSAEEAAGGVTSLEESLKSAESAIASANNELDIFLGGLRDTSQLTFIRGIADAQRQISEAEEALAQARTRRGQGSRALVLNAQAELSAAKELLIEREKLLENYIKTVEYLELAQKITRRNEGVAETTQQLQNQVRLSETILRYGEDSVEVERERNLQARAAFVNEQLRAGASADQIIAMLELVRRAQELDKAIEDGVDSTGNITLNLRNSVNEAIRLRDAMQQVATASLSQSDRITVLRAQIAAASRGASVEGAAAQAQTALQLGRAGATPDQIVGQATAAGQAAALEAELRDQLSALLRPPTEGSAGGAAQQDYLDALQKEADLKLRMLGLSEDEQRRLEIIFELTKRGLPIEEERIQKILETEAALQKATEAEQRRQSRMDSVQSHIERGFMSLIDGSKSVEEAFKNTIRSILADIYQSAVIKPIASGISSFLFGGRESGGSMMAGRPYLVGERGPEMVIPGRSATVTNADLTRKSMGGSDGVSVVNNINVTGGTDPAAIRMEVAKLMPQITNATKSAVIDARRRGGQMKAAFQ
jgi:hypothetical protein